MWLCSVGPRFHPSIVGPYSTLLITHVSEADKGNISCVGQEGKITISLEGTVRGQFYFTSKEHTVETPTLWWHDCNLNLKHKNFSFHFNTLLYPTLQKIILRFLLLLWIVADQPILEYFYLFNANDSDHGVMVKRTFKSEILFFQKAFSTMPSCFLKLVICKWKGKKYPQLLL